MIGSFEKSRSYAAVGEGWKWFFRGSVAAITTLTDF
jgi:hypothetical protein